MCLAIPGQVLEAFDRRGLRMARVRFGGVVREACLDYTPEAAIGDYVLVHVGFAISRVDAAEAHRTYALLAAMDQLTELAAPEVAADMAPEAAPASTRPFEAMAAADAGGGPAARQRAGDRPNEGGRAGEER